MELTKEQEKFLDKVCNGCYNWAKDPNGHIEVIGDVKMEYMNLTEIPIKFGKVGGNFNVSYNKLTTLNNFPKIVLYDTLIKGNDLEEYFKNLKEDDWENFKHSINFESLLKEYPFLINTIKKALGRTTLLGYLHKYPKLKLYLK